MYSYLNVNMIKEVCASGQTERQLGRDGPAEGHSSVLDGGLSPEVRASRFRSGVFSKARQWERARCLVVWAAFTLLFTAVMFDFRNLCSLKKLLDFCYMPS